VNAFLPASKSAGKPVPRSNSSLFKKCVTEIQKEKPKIKKSIDRKKMDGGKSTAWQPIATGGADFNEIWDDTELLKAFSKSISHYKVSFPHIIYFYSLFSHFAHTPAG
jgi:hypothetical protein